MDQRSYKEGRKVVAVLTCGPLTYEVEIKYLGADGRTPIEYYRIPEGMEFKAGRYLGTAENGLPKLQFDLVRLFRYRGDGKTEVIDLTTGTACKS